MSGAGRWLLVAVTSLATSASATGPSTYPLPGTAYPIDIEFDRSGTLWISSEFSDSLYSLRDDVATQHVIPSPAQPIFTSFGKPARISGLGEDVAIDHEGHVWVTQGGEYLYNGTGTNTSRVVRYDPDTDAFACFTLPANNAQAFAVHPEDDAVYVSAGGAEANYVARFQPRSFAPEQTRCRAITKTHFCEAGETDGCFERFDMPTPRANPARISRDRHGYLWISAFFANAIVQMDPDGGTMTHHELAPSNGKSFQAEALGSGPWSLVMGRRRTLWVLEGFDNAIVEFDMREREVVGELDIPLLDGVTEFAHTLIRGSRRSLWLSSYSTQPDGDGWIGRVDRDGDVEMWESGVTGGVTGLAFHPDTGDLYFAAFWGGSIGRFSAGCFAHKQFRAHRKRSQNTLSASATSCLKRITVRARSAGRRSR